MRNEAQFLNDRASISAVADAAEPLSQVLMDKQKALHHRGNGPAKS